MLNRVSGSLSDAASGTATNTNVTTAAAAITTKEKPAAVKPLAPPVPAKSYCFQCGDKSHTSRQCKHTGELMCGFM